MQVFKRKTSESRRAQPQQRVQSMFYTSMRTQEATSSSIQSHRRVLKARQWLHSLPSILGVVLILGSCVYTLTLSKKVRLHFSEDPKLRAKSEYISRTQADLGGWRSFSKLTFSADDYKKALQSEFPEAADITITVPLVGRDVEAFIQLDSFGMLLVNNGDNFIVSQRGRVLLKNPPSSIIKELPMVKDEAGLSPEPGVSILTRQEAAFIIDMYNLMKAAGVKPTEITLPPIPNEVHVKAEGIGYYIKYVLDRPANEEVGTYLALRDRLKKEGKVPAEYVDVRVDEKAYFK